MNGNLDSLVSSLDKISPENNINNNNNNNNNKDNNKNNGDISSNTDTDFLNKHVDNPNERLYLRVQNDLIAVNHDHDQKTANSAIINSNFSNFNNHFHLQNDKKFKNYKLICDPFLKKGGQKVYRYDGIINLV